MTVSARRARVAALRKAGGTQRQIAREIGASQATICRDIASVMSLDRAEAVAAIAAVRERDSLSLEAMEADAIAGFVGARTDTTRVRWADLRLRVMTRRSLLLGLDAARHIGVHVETHPDGEQRPDDRTLVRMAFERLREHGLSIEQSKISLLALGMDLDDLDSIAAELDLQEPQKLLGDGSAEAEA